jgi:ribosomal RNA-processing protein 9
MLYLETLYGHQFGITGIDCHRMERPISVGVDRTARAWKIAEDTHLIFRGGSKLSAADTITVVKDNSFVTGHQDGTIALWSTDKKRAVATIPQAHGTMEENGLGRGIVSVHCVKGSDLISTGSNDGYLRFWKINPPGGRNVVGSDGTTKKENRNGSFDVVGAIPIHGFINDIAISTKAKFCVVATGQEHRCGRWERIPRAKNRLAIIPFVASVTDETDDGDVEHQSSKDVE